MLSYKVLMNCPIRQPCFCSRLHRTRLKCNSQLFPSSRVLASAPQWPQLSYKYSKRQSLWQLLKCSFQLVTKRRMIILLTIKTDPHVAERNPEQHYVMSKFKLCLHSKGSPSPPPDHFFSSFLPSHSWCVWSWSNASSLWPCPGLWPPCLSPCFTCSGQLFMTGLQFPSSLALNLRSSIENEN